MSRPRMPTSQTDPADLTPRERQVLALADAGLSAAQIAVELGIKRRSVTPTLNIARQKRAAQAHTQREGE